MVCTALSIMQYIGPPLYILENNVGRISKINTKKDTAKRESWRSHFVPLKLSVVNIAWNLLYYNHFLIDTLDILFEKKKNINSYMRCSCSTKDPHSPYGMSSSSLKIFYTTPQSCLMISRVLLNNLKEKHFKFCLWSFMNVNKYIEQTNTLILLKMPCIRFTLSDKNSHAHYW